MSTDRADLRAACALTRRLLSVALKRASARGSGCGREGERIMHARDRARERAGGSPHTRPTPTNPWCAQARPGSWQRRAAVATGMPSWLVRPASRAHAGTLHKHRHKVRGWMRTRLTRACGCDFPCMNARVCVLCCGRAHKAAQDASLSTTIGGETRTHSAVRMGLAAIENKASGLAGLCPSCEITLNTSAGSAARRHRPSWQRPPA